MIRQLSATLPLLLLAAVTLSACGQGGRADGYGNFETDEVIVSAEGSGRIVNFKVREGDRLDSGAVAAVIDTTQLHLRLEQLMADRNALLTRRPAVTAETEVLIQQRRNIMRDVKRYQYLVSKGAAPKRQLEGFEDQVKVIDRQIASVETKDPEIASQLIAMEAHIDQIKDQLAKSSVGNPLDGIVLDTYAEEGELATFGKPLYKIASLDPLTLRVFLSGSQLSSIAIGSEVDVFVDGKKADGYHLKGRVTWISSKAEFTPKIIQTKEDRVTMVYAVKVLVDNPEGLLKIGMPAEIRFLSDK